MVFFTESRQDVRVYVPIWTLYSEFALAWPLNLGDDLVGQLLHVDLLHLSW